MTLHEHPAQRKVEVDGMTKRTSNPPVLLFVPSLTRTDYHTATRIARVIASSQSRLYDGNYSVEVDSRLDGPDNGASIRNPAGVDVLRVIDVDYRTRLAQTQHAKASKGWSLLSSGRFALFGILRLVAATGRSEQRSKTGRHRWFLMMGFAMVLMMISAFGFLALATLAALGVDQISWFGPSGDSNQLAWGSGLGSAAGALWWLRARVVEGSQRMGDLVQYLENEQEAASVALALDIEIDRLLEQRPPPPAIHILAYRFGSIVALDALFPRLAYRTKGKDRIANAVTSFVTVGCPVDFVRQFYPKYFEERIPRREDLEWTNLFLPEDVLSSNFLNDDDDCGFERVPDPGRSLPRATEAIWLPPARFKRYSSRPHAPTVWEREDDYGIFWDDVFHISRVYPTRSIPVGCERLTLKSLLSLNSVLNGEYWDQAQRANLLEPVIDTWISPDRPAEGSASAEKARATDGHHAGGVKLAAVDGGAVRPADGVEDRPAEHAAA